MTPGSNEQSTTPTDTPNLKVAAAKEQKYTVFPLLSSGNLEYASQADVQANALLEIAGKSDLLYQLSLSWNSKEDSLINVELPCPEVIESLFVVNLIAIADSIMLELINGGKIGSVLEDKFGHLFEMALEHLEDPNCNHFNSDEVLFNAIAYISRVIRLLAETIKELQGLGPKYDYPAVYEGITNKARLVLNETEVDSDIELSFNKECEIAVIEESRGMFPELRKVLLNKAITLEGKDSKGVLVPHPNKYALAFSSLMWVLRCNIAASQGDEVCKHGPLDIRIDGGALAVALLGDVDTYEDIDSKDSFYTIIMKKGLGITYSIGGSNE